MSEPFRLIHISDLHFHHVPRRVTHWLSKRGVGALNLLLQRKRDYPLERARRLVAHLDGMAWDHLVITGDLTQLSLEEEFELAHRTLRPLLARGPERVTVLPGNHDCYVQDREMREAYAHYFGAYFGEGEIATKRLTERWWMAGWDSTRPTPPLNASGKVRGETLRATEAWLRDLPPDARVIVANHYPIASPRDYPMPHMHDLENREAVYDWLMARPVDLYLHGHVHKNWILTVENNGAKRPLRLVNSASTTRVPRPGDHSAYHRIELTGPVADIYPLRFA